MVKKESTIIEAIESEKHFGPLFDDPTTWKNWIICLKAIFGLSMTTEELEIYYKYTGRSVPPKEAFKEIYLIIGSRGGKSFISALIAVYLALFKDWQHIVNKGRIGYIFVIASDKDQARNVMGYIKFMLQMDQFKDTVENMLKSSVILKNNIIIEIHTASFRGVRGYTILSAVCDELGVWRSEESANPSKEILNMIRPRMRDVEGSLLIGISTPKDRKGILWDAFRTKYGKEISSILVWRAPTRAMNPTYPQKEIDEAMEEDRSSALAEFYAEFRQDIESPFDPEAIKDVTAKGRKALLPDPNERYIAFCDPSGGRVDSFTLAIAHMKERKIILDRLEETRSPLDPDQVCGNYSTILTDYNCYQVWGDAYGGNFTRSSFQRNGIIYKDLPSGTTKSDLYLQFQAIINMGIIELLDVQRLSTQLQNLERRVRIGGRDTIDHPRGLHDDVANVAAGVAVMIYKGLKAELTPEYAAQRLPTVAGKEYGKPDSEYVQQKQRVLEKLRKEGVI